MQNIYVLLNLPLCILFKSRYLFVVTKENANFSRFIIGNAYFYTILLLLMLPYILGYITIIHKEKKV